MGAERNVTRRRRCETTRLAYRRAAHRRPGKVQPHLLSSDGPAITKEGPDGTLLAVFWTG
jgi:hypothetical protein